MESVAVVVVVQDEPKETKGKNYQTWHGSSGFSYGVKGLCLPLARCRFCLHYVFFSSVEAKNGQKSKPDNR